MSASGSRALSSSSSIGAGQICISASTSGIGFEYRTCHAHASRGDRGQKPHPTKATVQAQTPARTGSHTRRTQQRSG
eukprot:4769780-Prymnesium_polylepis.1